MSRKLKPLTVEQVKKRHCMNVLRQFNGNRKDAAEALGITPKTLYTWLERWNHPPKHRNVGRWNIPEATKEPANAPESALV
jgi:DNA-binding NtrC family response regulator